MLPSATVSLLFAFLALAKAGDPWATFDSNIKACTVIGKAYQALPTANQFSLVNFCASFVGTTTTTVTGETVVWTTVAIPLKTITVTGKAKPRHERGLEGDQALEPASPTRKRISPTSPTSAITPPPLAPWPHPAHENQELKRADAKLPTPAIFINQASLYIRTGCACLGFSTHYTLPVFTTTTATSTVPLSCARAPASAYHLSSFSPGSASAVAYELGWFYAYEPFPDPLEECCKSCQGRGGCVRFIYEKLDYAIEGAYARCSYLYFDDYDGNTVKGIPRLANEKPFSCPNGYLAINGLKTDTSSTTVSSATFLGPCAVSTVVAK